MKYVLENLNDSTKVSQLQEKLKAALSEFNIHEIRTEYAGGVIFLTQPKTDSAFNLQKIVPLCKGCASGNVNISTDFKENIHLQFFGIDMTTITIVIKKGFSDKFNFYL